MTTQPNLATRYDEAAIEAPTDVPVIRITRDFRAAPEHVLRAHTDADLFTRWIGPDELETRIDHWDARTGGSWRYTSMAGGEEVAAFHGCFHEVSPFRLVQTFTWEGWPEAVSLESLTVEDLGDGRCRLSAQSLVDSFETRDQWLASGMEKGIQEGYAKLDRLLAEPPVEG